MWRRRARENPYSLTSFDLIRVGDLVRVEGALVVDGDTASMVAVYVTMLGTNVAWRATGAAGNPGTGSSGSDSDVVVDAAPPDPAPADPAPVVAAPADPAPVVAALCIGDTVS